MAISAPPRASVEQAQVERAKRAKRICEAEHDTDQIFSIIETPEKRS